MIKPFFKLALLLISVGAFAQEADTLTYAEGNIYNSATKEPVTAKVTYMSLPYGNIIGTLNNSKFSFAMFYGERYSITVEAAGYSTVKYMLDPAEANADRKVLKDIELTAGGSTNGAKHAVGHVMRLDNLIFQVGKSKVDPESYPELNLVVAMMKENPKMVIQLEGHTDYQGDPKENMKLS